jgi:hypothetical protein
VERWPSGTVWGVLWDLALSDVPALDRYEGVASGLQVARPRHPTVAAPEIHQGPPHPALGRDRLLRLVERWPSGTVWGVLWDLALSDVPALDRYEGVASGLYVALVAVEGGHVAQGQVPQHAPDRSRGPALHRGVALRLRSSGSPVPLYFAYGSNMDRAAMARRCPASRVITPS